MNSGAQLEAAEAALGKDLFGNHRDSIKGAVVALFIEAITLGRK